MLAKIDALTRGVGCGFVPVAMAREAIAAGRLVVKAVQRAQPTARLGYAWRLPPRREGAARKAEPGPRAALVARATRKRDDAAGAARSPRLGRRHRRGRCGLKQGCEGTAMDDRAAARGAPYVGRFAPSPTGLLHAGSLVAALASWLDARAHGGRWLVRIEDLDTPRNVAGAAEAIVAQLESVGLRADGAVVRQSQRTALYEAALQTLEAKGRAYPCACSRRDLALAVAAPAGTSDARAEAIYPGTCRAGLHGKAPRSVRLRVEGVDGQRRSARSTGSIAASARSTRTSPARSATSC